MIEAIRSSVRGSVRAMTVPSQRTRREFGPVLASMREQVGLSTEDMSALSDVSVRRIMQIERSDDKPTVTEVQRLTGALLRRFTEYGLSDTK